VGWQQGTAIYSAVRHNRRMAKAERTAQNLRRSGGNELPETEAVGSPASAQCWAIGGCDAP
jgi:hypothetical protein